MKLKGFLKKASAVALSSAMLCTGGVILPQVIGSGFVANASVIEEFSHQDDDTITSYKVPNGVTAIEQMAFYECSNLKTVEFPSTLKTIENHAFGYCTELSNVKFSEGLNGIGKMAFCNDGSLNKLILPNSMKTIGNCAFYNSGVRTIYIPSGVQSIGEKAFYGCDGVKLYGTKNSKVAKDYVNDQKYRKSEQMEYTEMEFVEIGMKISNSQLTLGKGETTKLSANIAPKNILGKTVSWRTSDSKILTVDKNGNVKAIGTGTAWITAYIPGNSEFSASCKITVKNAPSKITLTKGILTIGVGEKYTLGASVNNGAAAAKRTYRTSNSSVVKMTRTDWNGVFVGQKPGIAYVTVKTYNGKESTCKVTVKAAPSSVTISKKNLTMKVGQTATLSCSVPSNAGCATRTFRTSNASVVKMTKTNWTGSFKAMKPGVAYVTVKTYNGKESTCKVTVTT